jgi:S1-C subfamily serine protease
MLRWSSLIVAFLAALCFSVPALAHDDEKDKDKGAKTEKKESMEQEHGFLGIRLAEGQEESTGPVKVMSVMDDGPAAKAGIKEGDEIVKIGDDTVKGFNTLRDRLAKTKPGDKIKVTVKRDMKEMTMDVTLGKMPKDEG